MLSANKKNFILAAIIILGIFLRSYNFHDWLDFQKDQVRDAFLVSGVLAGKSGWPEYGPTMKDSQNADGTLFRVGPAFYYFQIVSAKIFGNHPDKLAYPDLLFSVLTIPLFYLFSRRLFGTNLSLALTGLLAVSYFAVKFSRFAWNSNSIPFFSLLFLLSVYEILKQKDKTPWRWILGAGAGLGIGLQLHALGLVVFSVFSVLVFGYLLLKHPAAWKKIAALGAVVIFLNLPPLLAETKNGFPDAKAFFSSLVLTDSPKKISPATALARDADWHIEGNAYMLSSLPGEKCEFYYEKLFSQIFQGEKSKSLNRKMGNGAFSIGLFFSFTFFIGGCVLFFRRARKEKDEGKRIFLRLLATFCIVSFLAMLPLTGDNFREFRYFSHVFFLPIFLTGFWTEFIFNRFSRRTALAIVLPIFIFIFSTNFYSLSATAKELIKDERSDTHLAILGETEKMLDWMARNSENSRKIYLLDDGSYATHFFYPFSYLGTEKKIDIEIRNENSLPDKKAETFYLAGKDEDARKIKDLEIEKYATFGKVAIYKLKNK